MFSLAPSSLRDPVLPTVSKTPRRRDPGRFGEQPIHLVVGWIEMSVNDGNRRCSRCDRSEVEVLRRRLSPSSLRWRGDDNVIQLERVEGVCRHCSEEQTWYEPVDPQPELAR